MEALSAGASTSICIVANIAVNLIAFMALLAFTDDVISWLGHFVGHPEISFQVECLNSNGARIEVLRCFNIAVVVFVHVHACRTLDRSGVVGLSCGGSPSGNEDFPQRVCCLRRIISAHQQQKPMPTPVPIRKKHCQ